MMLDDLTSEGYTALNEQLEAAFRGVSRLRDYLRKHQTEPVPENQPDSTFPMHRRNWNCAARFAGPCWNGLTRNESSL